MATNWYIYTSDPETVLYRQYLKMIANARDGSLEHIDTTVTAIGSIDDGDLTPANYRVFARKNGSYVKSVSSVSTLSFQTKDGEWACKVEDSYTYLGETYDLPTYLASSGYDRIESTCPIPDSQEQTVSEIIQTFDNLEYHLPLDESSGTTANDLSSNGADATYTGVTLADDDLGDGSVAPTFDGVNDYIAMSSATGLETAIQGSDFTIGFYLKLTEAVWEDGASHYICNITATGNQSQLIVRKKSIDTFTVNFYIEGNAHELNMYPSPTPTDFTPVVIVYDATAESYDVYFDDMTTALGSIGSGVENWPVVTINTSSSFIGSAYFNHYLDGSISNFFITSDKLTQSERTSFASI
jgi:hypothetical protein